MTGAEGPRLMRDKPAKGDPAGGICADKIPLTPRKARAWSRNQNPIYKKFI